jgi:hypothetical protein
MGQSVLVWHSFTSHVIKAMKLSFGVNQPWEAVPQTFDEPCLTFRKYPSSLQAISLTSVSFTLDEPCKYVDAMSSYLVRFEAHSLNLVFGGTWAKGLEALRGLDKPEHVVFSWPQMGGLDGEKIEKLEQDMMKYMLGKRDHNPILPLSLGDQV